MINPKWMYYYLTIQLLAIVDSTNGKKRYIWFGFGRHVFSNNTADCYVSVYQSVSSHWQRFLWSRRQGWVDKLNYSTVDVYDSRLTLGLVIYAFAWNLNYVLAYLKSYQVQLTTHWEPLSPFSLTPISFI